MFVCHRPFTLQVLSLSVTVWHLSSLSVLNIPHCNWRSSCSTGTAEWQELSGTAEWQELSGTAEWQELSGTAEWQELSGTAEWQELSGTAEWQELSGTAEQQELQLVQKKRVVQTMPTSPISLVAKPYYV